MGNVVKRSGTFICLGAAMIAAVSVLIYANTLLSGFVSEDIPMIIENTWIKEPGHLYEIMTTGFWTFLEGKEPSEYYYRPMVHLIFSAEFRLFGLKPLAWHLVNVLMHTVNGVLVFLLATRLANAIPFMSAAEGTRYGLSYMLPGLSAALFYAAHPVHVETVAMVSAMSEISFTMTYLFSLYFYVRTDQCMPRRAWYIPLLFILSALFFGLAALSRETALTLPAMLLVYDFSRRGTALVRCWRRYIPFAVVVIAYLAVRSFAMSGKAVAAQEGLSTYSWLINTPPIILKYIEKLLFPAGLNAYYFFELYESVSLWTLLSAFVVLLIIAAIVYSRKSIGAFTALGLMYVPMLPALYLPGLMPMFFSERYLYLPTAGAAVLWACMLAAILRAYEGSAGIRRGIVAATCVIVLVLGWATLERNNLRRYGHAQRTDPVKQFPNNGAAFYNLGVENTSDGTVISESHQK